MDESLTFDEKFDALGEYYEMKSPSKIKNQIKKNENIFKFLEEVKSVLVNSFHDAHFCLEMNFEPEMDDEYIILRVKVPLNHFHNGARSDLNRIQKQLFPLRRELNVHRECLIMLGFFDV
ncbi:hypothetical protein [Methanobrevibacter sp.]|uniref:hypothetical protein n=1 Tax=Methanobrevibacter sp. TaxID=66852 RepID=UPI00388FA3F1